MKYTKGPKFQNHRSPKNKAGQNLERHPLVGQIFNARVIDLNSDGLGVVEHESGLKVFVAGACLQEEISVKITDHKGRWAFGNLQKIMVESPDRVAPACAHQGFKNRQCGGCSWMHIHYDAQLRIKQQKVEQAVHRVLSKQGVSQNQAIVKNILAASNTINYRNRAQLKSDGERIGFTQFNSKEIAQIVDCIVLSEHNQRTLKALQEQLPNRNWAVKSSKARKNKLWTRIDIDEGCDASNPSINQRLPFKQANNAQNSAMQGWLNERLATIDKKNAVLELFAGSGNFTQLVSDLGFEDITAVEVIEEAVKALGGIKNVTALTCDLFNEGSVEENLDKFIKHEVLLLDPPRDGFKTKELFWRRPKNVKVKSIFYVSCDLATFSRDAEFFIQHGYQLQEIQPVDMFPQTPHIELLAHFEK